MKPTQVEIGKAIRMGLAKKGLNQKDLASFLGISTPSVSLWMHGKTTPSYKYLQKMAEYLDIGEDIFPNQERRAKIALEQNMGQLASIISKMNDRMK